MPSGVWPSQSWIFATRGPRDPRLSTPAASAGAAAASRSAAPIRSAVSLAIETTPPFPGRRRRRCISAIPCAVQDFLHRGSGRGERRVLGVYVRDVGLADGRQQDRGAEQQQQCRRDEGDVEAVEQRGRLLGGVRLPPEVAEYAGGLVRRQRGEDGQAERAADLLRRVEEARGQP